MICQSCGSDKKKVVYPDLLDQCLDCGLIRADEKFFNLLQAETLYSEEYFKGAEYENYENDKLALQKNFEKRIKSAVKNLNQNSSVLELGCAYGYFYEVLRKNSNCRYFGMDVSLHAVAEAKKNYGAYFKAGDFMTEEFTEKFSDVFMWDVIEHLDKPSDFFKKIYQLLGDRGKVYITTGDIGKLIPKIQGKKWRMIHPPSHLFYFSKKTMKRFLENHGFEMVKIEYPPIYRSICLIYYSLFMLRSNRLRSIHNVIFKLINPKWYIPINTFDIMFVTAVKK
jgi:cyclopropane fatty-acyl-phospholipid synthase-like methyltransferase